MPKLLPLLLACIAPSFALGLFLAPHLGTPVVAQDKQPVETEDQRLERKVRELLVAMHTRDISKRGLEAMLGAFDKMPGLPKGFGARFQERFDLDHIVDLTVPIYMKHLEESTLDATLAFFASDEGKKLAEQQVDIMIESMQIGQEYGAKLGAEVAEELSGK